MEIQKVKLDELEPAPYNPRVELQEDDPDFIKLSNSMKEFGYIEPIIWNKRTGHIVNGHQRLNVLRAEGEKEGETVVVDLDEEDEKKLNVLLNRTTGEWDEYKLQQLFQELDEAGADLSITGFDDWELEGMLDEDAESKLNDILAFDEENEEETSSEQKDPDQFDGEEEQSSSHRVTFFIPTQYKPDADYFLTEHGEEEANLLLKEVVMQTIENSNEATGK